MNSVLEKIAEVAPDKYRFIVNSAQEVNESPFRDEILSELDSFTKKASVGEMWGRFANSNPMASKALSALGAGAATVGGAAAAGIAYSLAGDMYDAVKRGLTKNRHYKNMLAEDPDLARMPAKDVQKAFSVLHRFSPDLASDPTVAASWVKRQANFAEVDTKAVSDLISTRKNLGESKRLPSVPQIPGFGRPKGDPELESLQKDRMKLDITNNTDRDIRDREMHDLRKRQLEQQLEHFPIEQGNKATHQQMQLDLWEAQLDELRRRAQSGKPGHHP